MRSVVSVPDAKFYSGLRWDRRARYEYEYELGVLRGWKTFAVFATDRIGAYFGSRPRHDPRQAERVRCELGLENYVPIVTSTLAQAAYPRNESLFIGTYPHGVAITHPQLPFHFFAETMQARFVDRSKVPDNFPSRVLSLYPDGEVLAIVVHSALNLWGYSLFQCGKLRRRIAGMTDNDSIESFGAPMEEQDSHVLNICPIQHVCEAGYGEELVFDMTSRFFGHRMDDGDLNDLHLTEFRYEAPGTKRKPSPLHRILKIMSVA